MFIFTVYWDVDFGRHAGWSDASRGSGPTQGNVGSIATKITMTVYKTDYCDSYNIFMAPLVWYMNVQNCFPINGLRCSMHILPKFQIWWKLFRWDKPHEWFSGIVTSNAFATVPTMTASFQTRI